MAEQTIIIDTSVLIDYSRKTDKHKTWFVQLSETYRKMAITAITEFEIYTGATESQLPFWQLLLARMPVLPFDSHAAQAAVSIQKELKMNRKSMDKADLFIAAITRVNEAPLATLNRKHFHSVSGLVLL